MLNCDCVVVEQMLTGSQFSPANADDTFFKIQQQAALKKRIEESRALTKDDFVKCKEFLRGVVLMIFRFKPSVQC